MVNTNKTITLSSAQEVFSVKIPLVIGSFIKGTNTIKRIDDRIYINSGGGIPSDLYDGAWQFRKKITIDDAKVPQDVSDFPVLVNISDSDLSGNAQNDGDDILFTSSDGKTKLSHEIENYASGSGILAAWVKTALSSSADTVIYMYFGNPSAGNQENIADVWSNGYEAVYHLHDDFLDSTSKDRDAVNDGTVNAAGKIADGQDITPANELRFGTWNVSGQQITIQAWATFDHFNQDDPRIISKAVSGAVQDHVFMLSLKDPSGINEERYLRLRIKTGSNDNSGTTALESNTNPLNSGVWHLTAATYDGSNMRIYKDGGNQVASASKSGNLRQNGWQIWGGNNPNNVNLGQYSMDGKLDEIRISSIARSANWLTTEFNNQNDAASFYSIGSKESWSN